MRLRMFSLLLAAAMTPFAATVPAAMLGEVARTYEVSGAVAARGLTAFFVPFALLMPWAGSLARRVGAGRAVRFGFLLFAVGSALAYRAAEFDVFLAARALQGAASAVVTPVVLVAVSSVAGPARLARSMGLVGAVQSAASTAGPLIGGLAAERSWRLAFAATALVCLVLTITGVPGTSGSASAVRSHRVSRWRPGVLCIALAALVGFGALSGLSFLVALRAEDVFGLGPGARGLLLTGFGVVGLLSGRAAGAVVERRGHRLALLGAGVAGGACLALVGVLPQLAAVAVVWALCGAVSQLIQVAVSTWTVQAAGPDVTGEVSVVQAFRFGGGALSPILLGPVYQMSVAAAFLLPAVVLAVAVPALGAIGPRRPPPAAPSSPQVEPVTVNARTT